MTVPAGKERTFPLSESFMFFFNVWLVFIVIHLGHRYIITDVISRFIHAPYALGWLCGAVFCAILGIVIRKPWVRLIGNAASTMWWGTVWMLYMFTLNTIISLAFSIYALPLVVSITVLMQNYQKVKNNGRSKTDPVK